MLDWTPAELEAHGAAILSANCELYGDMSNRVMTTLSDSTDEVEHYSIDEAFLGLHINPRESFTKTGREIRSRILRHTGIPVSVGNAEMNYSNHKLEPSEREIPLLDYSRYDRRHLFGPDEMVALE